MPPALGELARHRTKDTVPFRSHLLALLLDEHNRILIKANIGAVLATERIDLSHDYGAKNIFFLHRFPWSGNLYRNNDHVADTGITTLGTAKYLEDPGDSAAGIVCY